VSLTNTFWVLINKTLQIWICLSIDSLRIQHALVICLDKNTPISTIGKHKHILCFNLKISIIVAIFFKKIIVAITQLFDKFITTALSFLNTFIFCWNSYNSGRRMYNIILNFLWQNINNIYSFKLIYSISMQHKFKTAKKKRNLRNMLTNSQHSS
jgi:hypothetical protein